MSEQLRALALAATPGKWSAGGASVTADETEDCPGLEAKLYGGNGQQKARNARFMAAANPAAILALLDELEDSHKAYGLLFKENAELRKDAYRYRWLRKRNTVLDNIAIFTARRLTDASGFFIQNELICDEEMDEEIDAAIDSAAKGESNE
jgi:hypothetical protein